MILSKENFDSFIQVTGIGYLKKKEKKKNPAAFSIS